MMETKQPKRNRWLRHTRNVFLAGFLTAIPLVATYLIFKWLFEALDGIFQPVIVFITGHRLPGVGLVAVIILVYIIGLVTANLIGRRLVHWFDSGMSRVPIIHYVYVGAKQVVDAVHGLRQVSFKKVVLVEFPKAGMYSLGFVTGKPILLGAEERIPVFILHTLNPMTGFLVLVAPKMSLMPNSILSRRRE